LKINNKIKTEIIELINDLFEVKYKDIDKKIKNIDSIEKVKLVIALEKKFKIEIKSKDFKKLKSINSIINLVIKK
jgi:acyl carrier protein